MKVLIIRGYRKNDKQQREELTLGEAWVDHDSRLQIKCNDPRVQSAIRVAIDARLHKGPVLRKYPKYFGPKDAPNTIVDAQEPIDTRHPEFLKWLLSDRWYWVDKDIAGYVLEGDPSIIEER
ncbi:MAG TPA: hypothetical protein VK694_01410 [Verrucomicrobiae bacterium]|nr:hypothetical protein [Verrucomicrobiae bacterium]